MKNKFEDFIKLVIYNIKLPEMKILPGQLAFYFLMMLIPLFTLLGAILNSFNLNTGSINDVINNHLPDAIAGAVVFISGQSTASVNVWAILIPALILASNGTHSIIIASNLIYKAENKNYIYNRVKAFSMIIVLGLLLIFMLIVPTFGNLIFKVVASFLTDSNNITNDISYLIFRILKYATSFFFIFISIKLLYVMAPNIKVKSKHVTYGALFTTVAWIICTLLYSVYIEHNSSYSTFYGGLSSILFLMIWLYALAYIFVLGMALNVSNYQLDDDEKH